MIADGKLLGIPAQIDLGNGMVGIATFFVAILSLVISFQSKKIESKRLIAKLRQDWLNNLQIKISDFAETTNIALNAAADVMEKGKKDEFSKNLSNANSRLVGIEIYISLILDENNKIQKILRAAIGQCRGCVAVFSTRFDTNLQLQAVSLLRLIEEIYRYILKIENAKIESEILDKKTKKDSECKAKIDELSNKLSTITGGCIQI